MVTISRAEYEQLRQEKAQMESTRVRLEAERIKLEAEHARLEAKLATLEQEQAQVITSLTLQNEWLLEQLKLSKKKLFGRSSEQAEQLVMDQLSLTMNEAEAYIFGMNSAGKAPVTVKAYERKRQSGNVLDVVPEGTPAVMKADVVYDAYKSIKDENAKVIYMSPQGKTLNQSKVEELSKEEHLIILCGHYEGIDQRVIDKIVDEEISIGDYVLTGGEIPAMALIDSVSRYNEGVLSKESIEEESFSNRITRISSIYKT